MKTSNPALPMPLIVIAWLALGMTASHAAANLLDPDEVDEIHRTREPFYLPDLLAAITDPDTGGAARDRALIAYGDIAARSGVAGEARDTVLDLMQAQVLDPERLMVARNVLRRLESVLPSVARTSMDLKLHGDVAPGETVTLRVIARSSSDVFKVALTVPDFVDLTTGAAFRDGPIDRLFEAQYKLPLVAGSPRSVGFDLLINEPGDYSVGVRMIVNYAAHDYEVITRRLRIVVTADGGSVRIRRASVGDADADLLPDVGDFCPGTPRGHRPDARGCSESQRLTGVVRLSEELGRLAAISDPTTAAYLLQLQGNADTALDALRGADAPVDASAAFDELDRLVYRLEFLGRLGILAPAASEHLLATALEIGVGVARHSLRSTRYESGTTVTYRAAFDLLRQGHARRTAGQPRAAISAYRSAWARIQR